jgi:tRNA dimethylallyltransferase
MDKYMGVESSAPLIVLLGPTASGKTALSIHVAELLAGERYAQAEVVNADSRQLYKYLDIGTAKITEEEMQGVPHHLIDVLDPKDEASAGWYQEEARKEIGEIHERGNIPLLVGGSMLYLSAITDGLTMAPEQDPSIRERLMREYDADSGKTLFERLKSIDPESAERIHPNNKPRLVRAVEIFELTKKPKSEAVPKKELRPQKGKGSECEYDLHILGVSRPREELVARILKRTDEMFAQGWLEEVKELIDLGYTEDDPGMKSHGYREIVKFLKEGEPSSIQELKELIAAKTRQYARRQMTWWKGDKRIEWIDAYDEAALSEIVLNRF